MATTASPTSNPFSTDFSSTTSAGATPVNDILLGPGYIHSVTVDNTASGASNVHVKLYDDAGPTVGGTDPAVILPVKAGEHRTFEFRCFDSSGNYTGGLKFDTAISYAVVQEAGTSGTTAPAATVNVYLTVTSTAT
ncbi:MAG: hypothetical protein D6681_20265 [Calditrichaeota bacterium]|nr:MAG: hypothetical protein D6681_20265 [Calditrichota bacterium]